MSLHEIDRLMEHTVASLRASPPGDVDALLFNLERVVPELDLDAHTLDTGAPPSEPMNFFELGTRIMEHAVAHEERTLALDWCAFLLNWMAGMPPDEAHAPAVVQERWLPRMRAAAVAADWAHHDAGHATLTLYPEGNDYFTPDHMALIAAFFDGL